MFYCQCCNYSTDKLFNYKKHCKTKKHLKNNNINYEFKKIKENLTEKSNKGSNNKLQNIIICDACNIVFKTQYKFMKHKSECVKHLLFKKIDTLEKKVMKYHHENNALKKIIKNNELMTKQVINTSNKAIDTVNESVKKGNKSVYNVVITQIKHPILLKKLENVKLIHNAYKDNEMKEFVKDLCSMQQNGSLYKFIGNFIIKQYKKKDITKQSLFSTDSSRNNFIYSTFDKDNKAIWKKDPKGLNIGSITLDNILMYIQDIIGEEQLKMVKILSKLTEYEVLRLSDIISTCNKIDRLIRHNNELKNKIVAYLSSNFGFDENELLLENS